ncbi:MAG: serine aminopeptidase domain-containing protein [Xanthobacteraceae bacterium]
MSDAIQIDDVSIAARDGYLLAGTVFVPAGEPRAGVLINSATAVPRKIYRGFATYLAERGLAALTFDYRGIGGSRPASLQGFPARMRDWAAFDVAGAIDHARKTWPTLPIAVVGHSFGGQAVGLVPNNAEITRALLVAAQAGFWRLFTSPEKYRVYAMMRLIGPPITHAMDYIPGARLGLGMDLPKGVFLEWSDWIARRRYFFDDPTLTALENFPRYHGGLRAVGLSDDPWATPAAIDLLLSGFTGTQPEHHRVHPRDVGAHKIGHFGFFRPEHRETLWRDAATWLSGEA